MAQIELNLWSYDANDGNDHGNDGNDDDEDGGKPDEGEERLANLKQALVTIVDWLKHAQVTLHFGIEL